MKHQASSLRLNALSLAVVLSVLFAPLFARTATSPKPGKRIWDTQFLDINRWNLPFYNDGRFAIDITKQNFPGGYWPAPIKNFYLFGGGLWLGAISAEGDTLVTVGYNPNSGGGEFYPTIAEKSDAGTGNSKDRVYKYGTVNWPPPREHFIPDNGKDTILVPKDNFSLQDMFMAFSDAYAPQHTSPGKPLGLDVFLTVYAWNYPANQDIFFLTYKVRNSTGRVPGGNGAAEIRNIYLGVCNDNDIGDAEDDMVGMIRDRVFDIGGVPTRVQNVGYIGDNNNTELIGDKWQGGTPGVCAMKFLESPRKPAPDTGQLGMTAFKKFTIDIDPVTDPNQYQTMAGLDYRTSIYNAYDSLDEAPGDKRIIQCSGPFTLQPESLATIVVAIIGSPYGREGQLWTSRTEADLIDLARAANTAQFIYDRGWLLPGPPEAPSVTLIPMDNKIRITWDNHSEVTPAKYYQVASDTSSSGWDPLYKKFDFEGYKVWKSTNGADWKLLTQCDLVDGDTFVDTTAADSIRIKATDSGIFYSFTDDSVINGFSYYYAVTAYCHNYSTAAWDSTHRIPVDTNDIILEGGKRGVSIIPRWDPVNVIPAKTSVRKVIGDTVNPAVLCSTRISVPFKVDPGDTYVLRFLPAITLTTTGDVPRFRWLVTKLKDGTVVFDTAGLSYQLLDLNTAKKLTNDLPAVGGITTRLKLNMGTPAAPFDTPPVVKSGSYPVDSLRLGSMAPKGKWAFRGSDYRIVWHRLPSNELTATLYDLTNSPDGKVITDTAYNIIPFTHFGTSAAAVAESANGWCFVNNAFKNASDILKRDSSYYLYICGGYLALNKGRSSSARPIGALYDAIADGDVWELPANRATKTSPAGNVFLIAGQAETPITQPDPTVKLNVRVVPNPYFITNRWETNTWERRIAFTGLPAQCDIRVYNLAGDLVRLINHHQTRTQEAGQAAPQPGELGGTEFWDLLNTHQQLIATGVYIFHVKSDVGEYVGKFSIVR
jgi:hypothetical protein